MTTYQVVDAEGQKLNTDVTLHPGEVLANELAARNISPETFAEKLKWAPASFKNILEGIEPITAPIAVSIEKEWGIDAGYWLRLQMEHDLKLARAAHNQR